MRPLRWLVLAGHVPPEGSLSGVVRYTTELLSGLARRDDVELHVLCTQQAAPALSALLGEGPRLHIAPALPGPLASSWDRFAQVRGEFDVVHGVKHLVPLRTRSATVVLTAHDMTLLDRPEDFSLLKRRLLPRPYLASLREADVVLCVSGATQTRVLHHVPAATGRTTVVPLATSTQLLDARPVEVAALAGRRFALVVGDSSPRKNLGTVVDAWPQVLRSAPGAVLAVAGPPSWGRTERGRSWDQLVHAGALQPLGRVDDAQLRWCYENASVVLCPSLAEGFGLPAAEALDLGARLIVSDDPALCEVAAGRAQVVPALDAPAWSAAIADALHAEPGSAVSGSRRTWDDVVAETVTAVRRAASTCTR